MKISRARFAPFAFLLPVALSPAHAAINEQTLIVTAAPGGISELDTPASVSVVNGETLRHAAPQINLSENLGSVPGLQIQNRQNFAQDLQLS
ncbi:TonB-dependent siderophore receptor, partial [Cronobacter muytjensii]|nr:TonB-dependent siderophore receptor [Cronobacter muytjensii]